MPLEFSQEVGLAVHQRRENENEEAYNTRRALEEKANLKAKIDRDDAQKTVTLTNPYTEPGKDQWAETLSFNQAMNAFTDVTTRRLPCSTVRPNKHGCRPRLRPGVLAHSFIWLRLISPVCGLY